MTPKQKLIEAVKERIKTIHKLEGRIKYDELFSMEEECNRFLKLIEEILPNE